MPISAIPLFDLELPLKCHPDELLTNKQLLYMLRSIRPSWTDANQIRQHVFTDGITNCLIAFDYDRSNGGGGDDQEISQQQHHHRHHDRVLVRIYGQNTDLFIDRKAEIFNLVQLYQHDLCPPVFARFTNGICYGYIPGQTISYEWLQTQGQLTEAIAEKMAKMHSIKLNDRKTTSGSGGGGGGGGVNDHQQSQSCLPGMMNKYLDLLDVIHLNRLRSTDKGDCSRLPDKQQLKVEVDQLCKHLEHCGSPVVFCHNDLLMKNIIYDRTTGSISFIDFEYGDFNYQAFDIGNHFCEYSGMEPFDPSRIPSRDYQQRWLKVYLKFYKQFTRINSIRSCDPTVDVITTTKVIASAVDDHDDDHDHDQSVDRVDDKEIDQLYRQVCKCQLASHLMWGVWALLQAQFSTIDFEFAEYASVRIGEYFRRKQEYMKL